MAIVWPCTLSVDEYAAAGREVEVPRVPCPACAEALGLWGGYFRFARAEQRCSRIWIRRGRCSGCGISHALLPGFLLRNRLDVVECIGTVLEAVGDGISGVRPAAEAAGVPHTTGRGWVRAFQARAASLAVAFAALGIELGGRATKPSAELTRFALQAIRGAFEAACSLPGWAAVGSWRFVGVVCGGSLLATNTNSPYLVVGKRRFMPPVP